MGWALQTTNIKNPNMRHRREATKIMERDFNNTLGVISDREAETRRMGSKITSRKRVWSINSIRP
jgi:hypothetical protein